MTVESLTSRVTYTGAGTVGPFTIPFYFLENDDLIVTKITIADSTETVLVLDTDYTVTGATVQEGGELTLSATLSSSYQLRIDRSPDLFQATDYPPADTFPAESHERALDKIHMILMRHRDQIEDLEDALDDLIALIESLTGLDFDEITYNTINVNDLLNVDGDATFAGDVTFESTSVTTFANGAEIHGLYRNIAASGTYTLTMLGDVHVLSFAAAGTITLLADETAGNGFHFYARAVSGNITINAAAGETIDGESSITILQGETKLVWTPGTAGNWFTLVNSGATLDYLAALSSSGLGSVRGLAAVNNSGTPNTQMDLTSATTVVMTDPDTNQIAIFNAPASITINISTAGPTVNGRDQAGAFSNSSWLYFYYITNDTLVRGLVSASATAPTLPTGYTKFALATAVYLTSGGTLKPVRTIGGQAYYNDITFPAGSGVGNVLANGSATSFTSVDASAFVPPSTVCASFHMFSGTTITIDGGGTITFSTQFTGTTTSIGITSGTFSAPGLTGAGGFTITYGESKMPNIGQAFAYKTVVTAGSAPLVNSYITSYSVSNGG